MKLKKFKEHFISTPLGKIFCRSHGSGPALLLLHGYPQTHLMWHKIAPELSKYFTLVVADLRGYGSSFVLPADKKHLNYSKKAILLVVLKKFLVLGIVFFFIFKILDNFFINDKFWVCEKYSIIEDIAFGPRPSILASVEVFEHGSNSAVYVNTDNV